MEEYRGLAWTIFVLYIVITTGLAIVGMLKTKDLRSFAIGNGDMGPVLVGITLAASVASTATFVINPGFVWKDGVAALLHFGVATAGGVTLGIIVLSKGFRRVGTRTEALTLPHWIGARFDSVWMRTYFALLNLALAISFVVLIIKGSALVMGVTLGMSYVPSVFLVVGFVFSYILVGGTYAHAFTNAFQGSIMVLVALAIFGSGLYLFGEETGFFAKLAAEDANLVTAVNPKSVLFNDYYTVFFCGFIVGIGLVCQPHILMKSLYLKSDKDVNMYLLVYTIIGGIFALILVAGLYARITMPEYDGAQDAVMAVYIAQAFHPIVAVLISVALLAAGMSTMDSILVSASTIAGSDLFNGVLGQTLLPKKTDEERAKLALWASRIILVGMAVISLIIAVDPPTFVGIFAQLGVYGLVAASMAPVTLGIFFKNVPKGAAFAGAVVGPIVHFGHYFAYCYEFVDEARAAELTAAGMAVEPGLRQTAFLNPAVSATSGALVSLLIVGAGVVIALQKRATPEVAETEDGDHG
ncbi:MAG: sodium:solute symporter family protein [Myxococcota bacterium]